ncbi:MAG: CDP-alcohol phosphatidyltransferase family protein, partial [Gemmatimonadaceae bacterium]
MNLPNALTVGRIVITPLIAVLPFANSWGLRLAAFALFVVAAVSDYVDGRLARSRKQETDFGRLLDPFADKLLLVGTFVPMYLLAAAFPFVTPFGDVGLAWWVIAIVLGRELFMTIFRQAAARRGVVIAA